MKPHDTFLELAAIAIDFPLAPAERGRLEAHLAGCPACDRTAHALRGDAMALAYLPPVVLPERRGAEILAAALHPHAVRNPVRLLVVAALLGLLLLGSLAAGAELLRRMDQDDLGIVLPVPSQAASPDVGPSASPGPAAAEPPGRLVVTHADPSGDRRVELLDLDGLGVTNLTPGLGWDPAWLSDTQVVYTCPRMDETLPGICAVDSTKPDELPRSLLAEADHPVPAPDGRTIAIHRGTTDVGETWIMSADGSNPQLLRSGWFPRWSPDGAWLAGQPEGTEAQVAVVGADGQGFRVLAPGYDPAWSPTGLRIAFAVVEGDVALLRTVDLASGAVEILHTAPAGEEISAPAYLAEGRIAFVQDGNVWIFDSSGPRAIMSGHAIEGSPAGDPLAVSPGGSRIAFTHGTGAEATVEIREINGGNTVYPASGPGPVTQPAWAPTSVASQPSDGTPTGTASPGTTPAAGSGAQLGDRWVAAQVPVVVGRPVGRIEAVTAGGPGFVAVGRGCVNTGADLPTCEGVVWTSTDGTAWQRTPAGDPTDTGAYFSTSGPEIGMFDVAAGGPGIVAIGYAARPDMAATIWFSSDNGASWEGAKIGDVGSTRVNAIAWDGRQFVMVGEDRSQWDGTLGGMAKATARAAVWTSTDGYNFTRVAHSDVFDVGEFRDTMEDPSTGGMKDVVAGPAGLVAVGSVCTAEPVGCRPMAWTSTDGIAWERAAAMQAPGDQAVIEAGLTSVAASDTGYIGVGAGWELMSPDGRRWERKPFIDECLNTVTTIGKRFFAVCQENDGRQSLEVLDDKGELQPWFAVGELQSGTIYNPAEWHFAATSDIAVAVGPAVETDDPMAMVSVGE